MLIGARDGLQHLVVSAEDHLRAWEEALAVLGPAGVGAVLEEMENTGQRAPARAGLVCRLPPRGLEPDEPPATPRNKKGPRPCPWSGGGSREPARRRRNGEAPPRPKRSARPPRSS